MLNNRVVAEVVNGIAGVIGLGVDGDAADVKAAGVGKDEDVFAPAVGRVGNRADLLHQLGSIAAGP